VVAVLAVSGGLVFFDATRLDIGSAAPPQAQSTPAVRPSSAAPPPPPPAATVVHSGLGTFGDATGASPVAGAAGELDRYHVAVENGIGLDAADFARTVDAILDDPRGWTAGGTVRFQRVPAGTSAEFTVYLASPATAEMMCREGGLEIDEYTNCRLSPGKVVINSARWLTAVPDYGASLDVYRGYAVNHEVGHQLGHEHELCPAPGQPAPVMQQQTLGLHGCLPNSWAYLNGVRYQGPPGPA
jgi:hypothetical protein